MFQPFLTLPCNEQQHLNLFLSTHQQLSVLIIYIYFSQRVHYCLRLQSVKFLFRTCCILLINLVFLIHAIIIIQANRPEHPFYNGS